MNAVLQTRFCELQNGVMCHNISTSYKAEQLQSHRTSVLCDFVLMVKMEHAQVALAWADTFMTATSVGISIYLSSHESRFCFFSESILLPVILVTPCLVTVGLTCSLNNTDFCGVKGYYGKVFCANVQTVRREYVMGSLWLSCLQLAHMGAVL